MSAQPTVLILASGRGERFIASGGHGSKLDALLNGKTVLEWTLEAVKAAGLPWHVEAAGHPGMGDSIAAAVRATSTSKGWLILPADLPLVSPQTICAVANALAQGAQAAYPEHAGERGHPVGFAAWAGLPLLSLSGNLGAAGILSALNATKIVVNDLGCVRDVDRLEDLSEMQRLLSLRNV
ncbi:MAG: NTP transferase domain-containing protein [Brachymonas sp.]